MRARLALLVVLFVAAVLAVASTGYSARVDEASPQVVAESPALSARIDELLAEEWRRAGVEPAAKTSDGEFVRRVYLDLTGVIPRTSEVRAFLADERPDKRTRLVDELLASPRYATHMATTWRNRILPLGEDVERTREALGLQKWLRTRFADNLRYDRIVSGLLLASGENELGPALYFQANNLEPEKLAGSAAELFMGVDLHCAQCHDHPFADWTQRDFWGLAAFFAQVKSADADMTDPRQMSYRITDLDRGEVTLPESEEVVPPRFPRGDAASDVQWQSRRSQLVVWLTSRDNPFFARATVNAAWQHLFGEPLVASVRPFAGEQDSPRRQLLDELAEGFVQSNFDIRQLWRTLALSQAYQLSSRHPDAKAARPELFARMLPKPLSPEQLYDSFLLLAPNPQEQAAGPDGAPALSLDEDPRRVEFVQRMRTPPGDPTEYRAGTLQALMLMNGPFTAAVAAPDGSSLLGALDAPYLDNDARIDALFLATLAREPAEEERAMCVAQLDACTSGAERRAALGDMLWAVLNSTEFAFNH